MAAEQPWYVGERAEALAIVYLTRREDLDVVSASACMRSSGYDLLVYVGGRDEPEPVTFAVEVKGQLSHRARSSRSGDITFSVPHTPRELQTSGIPVCLFLFTVDDRQGFNRWLFRPVITPEGKAELVFDEDSSVRVNETRPGQILVRSRFRKLTNEAIDVIVDEVTKWHKASH